jgi:hypothetical protein
MLQIITEYVSGDPVQQTARSLEIHALKDGLDGAVILSSPTYYFKEVYEWTLPKENGATIFSSEKKARLSVESQDVAFLPGS